MVQVPATSMPSTVHIPSPLPVVCLALGDLYGLADRYITRMQGMLETHCPVPFKLICYSDLPRVVPASIEMRDCKHWSGLAQDAEWPVTMKLGLFSPDLVDVSEFLYLDLTLVIRADMGELLAYAFAAPEPLVIVEDWFDGGYNSSVMRIRQGPLSFVHEAFAAGESFAQRIPGDQHFIHAVVHDRGVQDQVALFPADMVASYKQVVRTWRRDAKQARRLIDAATIVKFHGAPKMHQAFNPVYHLWRVRLNEWMRGVLFGGLPMRELRRHWSDPHG